MNNFEIFKNKRFLTVFGIIMVVLILITFALSFIKPNSSTPNSIVDSQDSLKIPTANFTGDKSIEFYKNISDYNYTAARKIVGDFLVNTEKLTSKDKPIMAPSCEILLYSTDYGDDSTYLVNFDFKSLDNGKKYKAQIVNYMDNSQSSYIKIIDYNYQKTFANNL